MSSSRARRTVVAAAFLSAGLVLSGCGATVDAGRPARRRRRRRVLCGHLRPRRQDRLPQLAVRHHGDQREHRPRLAEAGRRRDQRGRRRARQAAHRRSPRTAPRSRRVRREGREADPQRLRRGGVRRLDLVLAARRCCRSSRATTRCCSTRCSTRAWSRRRTSSTPARPPTSRSCPALDYLKEQGAKSLFLVGSDYVFPQTANKIIKAYAAANGMEIKGEEYAPLGYTDFAHHRQQGARRRRRRGVQHPQRRLATWPSSRSTSNLGLTADGDAGGVGVDRRGGGRRHRRGQHRRPAGGLELLPDHRQPGEQEVRRRLQGRSTARTRSTWTRWRPPTPRSTCGRRMVEKANSFDVPDVQAAAGGVSFDAPEGTVTVNGDEPPHRQDRADRQDRRRTA